MPRLVAGLRQQNPFLAGATPGGFGRRDSLKQGNETMRTMKRVKPRPRSREALTIIRQARERYAGDDNILINDNARITHAERGAWVSAWLWIEDPLTRSDLEEID
jgi:hypothetical protein